MSLNTDNDSDRQRIARVKLLRAACAFANVVAWSIYANLLRDGMVSAGYSSKAVMYSSMTAGAIGAAGGLHSVKVGLITQVVVVVAVLITAVLL